MPESINPELRNSETGGIATGNLGRPSAVSSIGQVRAQQADTTKWGPDVLGGLLGFAEGVTKQWWVDTTEREYADAARARTDGKAFEELEGNPLLKPFRRGGFQDMDHQLGMADVQTKYAKWVGTDGKRIGTEEARKELNRLTSEVWMQTGDGLSRKQRSSTLQAQMQMESSLMNMHTKAHAEWQIQDKYEKLSALVTSNIIGIQDSAGSPESVQNIATSMLRIRDELPWDMAGPMLEHTMKTLYEDGYWQQADALFKGGEDGMGVTQGWDLESRYKMESASRAAYDKHLARTELQTQIGLSTLLKNYNQGAKLSAEQAVELPEEILAQLGNVGVAKYMAGKEVAGTANKTAEHSAAYALKDPTELNRRGLSTSEAGDAYYTVKKAEFPDSPAAFVRATMATDAHHGYLSPVLIKDLGLSLTKAIDSTEVSEYDAEFINTFAQMFRQSFDEGNNAQRIAEVEARLPADMTGLFTTFARDGTGRPIDEVILEWRQARESANATLNTNRVVSAANMEKMRTGLYSALTDDTSNATWRFAKDLFGVDSREVAPDDPSWNQVLGAVNEEMNYLITQDAGLANLYANNPDILYAKAIQSAKDRTITLAVDTGFLGRNHNRHIILPRTANGTVEAMDILNTDRSGKRVPRDPSMVQAALEQQVPVKEGFSVEFGYSSEGIRAYYISDDTPGEVFPGALLNFEKAAEHIDQTVDKLYKTAGDSVIGVDYTLRDTATGADINVRMDGRNFSGLDTVRVLKWRQALADDEGVRQQVYDDVTREGDKIVRQQKAFGIGHSVPADLIHRSEHLLKDGAVSAETISGIFAKDTAYAIRDASVLAQSVGIEDENAVLAIAELVFQMGSTKAQDFTPTYQHIAAGRHFSELEDKAKQWPWYKQTPKRVDKFLQAVKPAYRD